MRSGALRTDILNAPPNVRYLLTNGRWIVGTT